MILFFGAEFTKQHAEMHGRTFALKKGYDEPVEEEKSIDVSPPVSKAVDIGLLYILRRWLTRKSK